MRRQRHKVLHIVCSFGRIIRFVVTTCAFVSILIGCTVAKVTPATSPMQSPILSGRSNAAGTEDIIGRYRVEVISMAPALVEGEYIFINNLSYSAEPLQRGDIIVFKHPGEDLVKRIIGLPGETIEIRDGHVLINGLILNEAYLKAPMRSTMPAKQIERDHYFVLGDNRNNSSDSRVWGAISKDDIIGRVWFVYWPLSHMRLIWHHLYPTTVSQ